MTNYYVYDTEVYPNCFTFACRLAGTDYRWLFEISQYRDDTEQLLGFLDYLYHNGRPWMVGFNNVNFDWPIVQGWWENRGRGGYQWTYDKCQQIIGGDSFSHRIWEPLIPQVDLFLIHHFNNRAKSTGLKQVEFNMRVPDLMDLPFPPGTVLTPQQIEILRHYNMHGDVDNTLALFEETREAIDFRLTFGPDWVNYNDGKIGKQYFIDKLNAAGIQTHRGRDPIQSKRPEIRLGSVILPMVQFNNPEFQRILDWFRSQVVTETKGVFNDVSCSVGGLEYHFGLGGIHGSVDSCTIYSDDDYVIEDWDVASYYPNLAIENNIFPEHLGSHFCNIYRDVYEQRKQFEKGTPQNAAMKLALNSVYGDSNNQYSCFYDPAYTMAITINGQLLLCMLAEQLQVIPGLRVIQINTDGLTLHYPERARDDVRTICQWWEGYTALTLENVVYDRMFIRDVNNYIAVDVDGKIKRKGAYEYEREHHQNHSALVIPKIAEQVLVHGVNLERAVREHTDIFDFCLRVKAPRLELDGVPQQGTCRYYVSLGGGTLKSIKPPPAGMKLGDYKKAQGVTNKQYWAVNQTGVHDPRIHTKNMSRYTDLVSEVEKGWQVTVCNSMTDCVHPINYDYYIDRVKKLVEPVR